MDKISDYLFGLRAKWNMFWYYFWYGRPNKDILMIRICRKLEKYFEYKRKDMKRAKFFFDWKIGWIEYQYGEQSMGGW